MLPFLYMSIEVTINYDKFKDALEWAKENCPNYITNKAAQSTVLPGYYDISKVTFYFSVEKEAVAFALRWI